MSWIVVDANCLLKLLLPVDQVAFLHEMVMIGQDFPTPGIYFSVFNHAPSASIQQWPCAQVGPIMFLRLML